MDDRDEEKGKAPMIQNRSGLRLRRERVLHPTLWPVVSFLVYIPAEVIILTHGPWHEAWWIVFAVVVLLANSYGLLGATILYGAVLLRGPDSAYVQRVLRRLPKHYVAISWAIASVLVVCAALLFFLH
jgi:hypothetical protein